MCDMRRSLLENSGAGNESRTLDLNLGQGWLYQLSCSRTVPMFIEQKPKLKLNVTMSRALATKYATHRSIRMLAAPLSLRLTRRTVRLAR